MADTDQKEELTEEEAEKRRDEALKRALNMPPKPKKTKQETAPVDKPRRSKS